MFFYHRKKKLVGQNIKIRSFSDISYTKRLIKRVTAMLLMLHNLSTCNYIEKLLKIIKLSNIHFIIQHGKQPLSTQPVPDYFHYLQT